MKKPKAPKPLYKSVFDHPRKKRALAIYGKPVTTMDDIGYLTIAVLNQQDNDERIYNLEGKQHISYAQRKLVCVGLKWTLTRSDRVSNSHSGPLLGYSNWNNDYEDGVRNYPGWEGRVWVRYAQPREGFGKTFEEAMSFTGTGGWGAYDGPWTNVSSSRYRTFGQDRNGIASRYPEVACYSYDYRMYESDWPEIAHLWPQHIAAYEAQVDQIKKDNLLNTIKTVRMPFIGPMAPLTHVFFWEDPATKAKDEDFLDRLKTGELAR